MNDAKSYNLRLIERQRTLHGIQRVRLQVWCEHVSSSPDEQVNEAFAELELP